MGRYVTGIDETITTMLEKNGTIGYNELWRSVNSEYRKTSLGSFDYHIKSLLSRNVIRKEDSGLRGKPVLYYLTSEAKQEMALKVLNTIPKSEKSEFEQVQEENKRLMLFFVLFLLDTYPVQYRLKKEQVDQFLSKFDLKLHDLVVKDQDSLVFEDINDSSRSGTRCIYYDLPVDKIKFYDQKYEGDLSLWKEIPFGGRHEPVIRAIRSTRGMIAAIPSSKYVYDKELPTSYVYELPGVSISDIVNSDQRPTLEHINFTKEETEEVIRLAIRQKLLKPILEFDREIRYAVSSSHLRRFFSDLDDLYESVKYKIVIAWMFHRRPTKGEIKWMNLFEGIKKTQELRDMAYHKRHTVNLKTRKEALKDFIKPQEMNIKENLEKVKKKHLKVIRKYNIPLVKLLRFVYPSYIHTSSENYELLIRQ